MNIHRHTSQQESGRTLSNKLADSKNHDDQVKMSENDTRDASGADITTNTTLNNSHLANSSINRTLNSTLTRSNNNSNQTISAHVLSTQKSQKQPIIDEESEQNSVDVSNTDARDREQAASRPFTVAEQNET